MKKVNKQTLLVLIGIFSILNVMNSAALNFYTIDFEESIQISVGDEVTYEIIAFQEDENISREVTMSDNDISRTIIVEEGLKITIAVTNIYSELIIPPGIDMNAISIDEIPETEFVNGTVSIDGNIFENTPIDQDRNNLTVFGAPYIYPSSEFVRYSSNAMILVRTRENISYYEEVIANTTDEEGYNQKEENFFIKYEMDGDIFIEIMEGSSPDSNYSTEYERRINMKTGWVEYYYEKYIVDNQVFEFGYQFASKGIPIYPPVLIFGIGLISILYLIKTAQRRLNSSRQ